VKIKELRIQCLRNISQARLDLSPKLTLLVGPNGAGKTAVLEALFLLGRGRSFRGGNARRLIKKGSESCQVYGRLETDQHSHRLGVSRSATTTEIRIDGRARRIVELAKVIPVQIMEPGGFALLDAAPNDRRRWMDWGLFHVEQTFYDHWKRYRRILAQRNAALRAVRATQEIKTWTAAFCQQATALTRLRLKYLENIGPLFASQAQRLGLPYREVRVRYRDGGLSLHSPEADLEARIDRDREAHNTVAGPHRADFIIEGDGADLRGRASRGQHKLLVLALMLAQAKSFTLLCGHAPLLLFDDLFAELDAPHQQMALETVAGLDAQTVLTSLSETAFGAVSKQAARLFHVEQGGITPTGTTKPVKTNVSR